MSRVKSRHPDDFTLLRHNAGELEESDLAIRSHLEKCEPCLIAATELRRLDSSLRQTLSGDSKAAGLKTDDLPPDDPFFARPRRSDSATRVTKELANLALESADRGGGEVDGLLAAALIGPQESTSLLDRLSFANPAARYLILYALEEAGRRVTNAPGRFLRFAESALERLGKESVPGAEDHSGAEVLIPLSTLVGQAHLLAGQSATWTGELEKARYHFEDAYRSLRWESESDEIRIAMTEFGESQRRSFAGSPAEGVVLARRARVSFERFGLDDFVARARVAEGVAVSLLGRDEDALTCFRSATPVFESHGLWRNYVAAVNSIGFSLARLGRLNEARREYSRALRIVSRERHPSLLAFARNGMAHVLFFGGRYADAAKSFLQAAGLFEELEQIGDVLTANLWEIESWARSGDLARARHRLEIFRAVIGRAETLDPFIVHQLEEALAGRDLDLEAISELRQRAELALRERFEAQTG